MKFHQLRKNNSIPSMMSYNNFNKEIKLPEAENK